MYSGNQFQSVGPDIGNASVLKRSRAAILNSWVATQIWVAKQFGLVRQESLV